MAWTGSFTANRRRLVGVATAVPLLALVASLSVPAAQAAPPAPLPPTSAVLFGLDDHWESNIVTDDTQDSAVSGIVGTFLNWGTTKASSIINYANWARSRQAIPMIDLHPPATATLASIAAGGQDAALIADAKALHAWNHAFMFRLFPEMNGRWETYAPGREGQTAAQFIAAWRHVFSLFRQYGATKVMFVWNPDKEYRNQPETLQALWPGSNYVNWVGIDVFDREDKAHGTFANPVTAITPTVTDIRTFSRRPLMIAESGTVTSPVKATWINQLFTGTASLGVKAVVYFNEMGSEANGSASWRLNSSSDALTATQQTLAGTGVAWPGHNNGSLFNDEHLILHAAW
jgi:Glycosyl hydrolase family 26